MLNTNLRKLVEIAEKESRLGIGLMSGTSLDGLDIALCRFMGSGLYTTFQLLHFTTVPYDDAFRKSVQQIFAKKQADQELLCLLNAQTGVLHAQLILKALQQWDVAPTEVDFIASHGQTVYHAPKRLHQQAAYPNATLQIGDGDHIALKTGILTISDFRQKHIAAGGEGAPLALYGDVILGSKSGENRILLNMGGIANLTFLPADGDAGKIICTDIGPGNTLIDAVCRRYFNKPYDEDAAIAYSGKVNELLLAALLEHPFFKEPAPKTTGPELFSLQYLGRALGQAKVSLHIEDIVTTLSAFTATAISNFINENMPQADRLFVSGGGAKNPFIINQLKEALPRLTLEDTSALGIDPDAKEAILFALLGNEALVGEPLQIGNNPAVLMGKFSFPL